MFSNANPFLTSSLWLFPRFFGFLSRFLSSFFPFLLLDNVSASSRIVSGCVSTCHPSCPSSCLLSSLSAFSRLSLFLPSLLYSLAIFLKTVWISKVPSKNCFETSLLLISKNIKKWIPNSAEDTCFSFFFGVYFCVISAL